MRNLDEYPRGYKMDHIANALDAIQIKSAASIHVKLDKEGHKTPDLNDYRGKLKST